MNIGFEKLFYLKKKAFISRGKIWLLMSNQIFFSIESEIDIRWVQQTVVYRTTGIALL